MDILGLLIAGVVFLFILSLLAGNNTVENSLPTAPVQVFIQPQPDALSQSSGCSGVLMWISVLGLLFFLIMLQAP